MRKREATACGSQCEMCEQYKVICPGCDEIQGKVYWAKSIGVATCPVYMCCIRVSQHDHCGQCKEVPCNLFYDTQDPSCPIEQHVAEVEKRMKVLDAMQQEEQ